METPGPPSVYITLLETVTLTAYLQNTVKYSQAKIDLYDFYESVDVA